MKIGAANYALQKNLGEEQTIKILSNAGFDSIDFDMGECNNLCEGKLFTTFTDGEFEAHFHKIREYLDQNNIKVEQTHALTGHFSFTSTQEYFNQTVKCIKATSILGGKYTVIHPLIYPEYRYDENREICKNYNMDFYTRLIPYLEKYDVKNGVENMWHRDPKKNNKICPTVCSRPEEIADYIDSLKSDRFVACLDLGHVNLTSEDTGDTVAGAIKKLGKYIEILHIHDNDGLDDLHLPPFMGNMDWKSVASALSEINYSGTLNFEVGSHYFDGYGVKMYQQNADYMAQTGAYLAELIKNQR